MPEMFCCNSRMRIDRNGVALVFHEQIEEAEGPVRWRAYQIYESDRWTCPRCSVWVHTGLGQRPIIERHTDVEKFEAYLAELKNGKFTDMIGRPQPWVDIFE